MIDSRRGVFKVKETTKTLVTDCFGEKMYGCQRLVRQIDHIASINNYQPVSRGNSIFFPLKQTPKQHQCVWIANHQLEIPEEPNPKCLILHFKDCPIKIKVPVGWYFIESRLCACRAHQLAIEEAWKEFDLYVHSTPSLQSPEPNRIIKELFQGLLLNFSTRFSSEYDMDLDQEELKDFVKYFMHNY